MKLILTALALVTAMNCGNPAQETNAKELAENVEQEDILVGKITQEDLEQAPFSAWWDPMYKSFKPSEETMNTIKDNINDYEIKVFMGTWCGDSKREVPKLYKLLNESGYNMDKIEMQGVTHAKTLPNDLQEEYDVHHVPTVIFYKNGKEVNRFVEYPQEEFEDDIAKIVSGEEYHNSYE
jgi:thiol-disulfide isomerase/thioredoxin